MDKELFLIIQKLANKYKFISSFSIKISNVSSYLFFIIYLCELIFLILTKSKKTFLCLLIPFITLIISNVIRNILKRERPFNKLNMNPLIPHKNNYSFPSNHSVSSMIISLSLLYVNFTLGLIFIFISILTGLSRIATGVHYPYDVIAGWILSILMGTIYFT